MSFSPSFLKDNFTGSRILDWRYCLAAHRGCPTISWLWWFLLSSLLFYFASLKLSCTSFLLPCHFQLLHWPSCCPWFLWVVCLPICFFTSFSVPSHLLILCFLTEGHEQVCPWKAPKLTCIKMIHILPHSWFSRLKNLQHRFRGLEKRDRDRLHKYNSASISILRIFTSCLS